MQSILKRFMLIGAVSLFFSPVVAYSQTKALSEKEEREMEKTLKRMDKFLGEEIKAGKLTPKQAFDYIQCAEKDARAAYMETPEAKEYDRILKKYGMSLGSDNDDEILKKMGPEKGAAYMKDMMKVQEAQEPLQIRLQDQAEERCMKKLGVKVPRGEIWDRR